MSEIAAVIDAHWWQTVREEFAKKPILLGLDRVKGVLKNLGSPSLPVVVEVAGTNGKGSVCAILESILQSSGYRVGLYSSPHLLSFRERIRINLQSASDEQLNYAFTKVVECAGSDLLTQFELDTLAAVTIFSEAGLDVVILEVGLGGRLDAVNVFDADCAVVTSVDIDHTDYLGETREQIAFEKAGIFRQGRVAIFADSDVPQAIRAHAQEIGAELWCIGDEFGFTTHQNQWDYRSKAGARMALPHPGLRGTFQLHNASAALAALDVLKWRLPVSMDAVRHGLVKVQLAGRFQFVPGKPQVILDVAHNPHAARTLAQNLVTLPPCPHTYAVFAMLKDKDMAGVAATLNPRIDTWLVAGIAAPRGASAEELVKVLHHVGVRGAVIRFPDIAHAVSHACNVAGDDDRIAVFGSFHTVAEAMLARGVSVI